jgi:hypothetical protein
VTLTPVQRKELSSVVNDRGVDAVVASRARMVLWRMRDIARTRSLRWPE